MCPRLLADRTTPMLCERRTKTGQGWGITSDGSSLIVSDGSEYLFFWDPVTMKETRRIEVRCIEGEQGLRI